MIDTGVIDDDRYLDVFVEYAKESPEDILIQVTIHNCGPDPADLHVLPTLWLRNLWSWLPSSDRPLLWQANGLATCGVIAAKHADLGEFYLYCDGDIPLGVSLVRRLGSRVPRARPDAGRPRFRQAAARADAARAVHAPQWPDPAYEWNFGDVNPPVHAWSTIYTYRLEKGIKGQGDKEWLKTCFQKLLLNLTWWVNRKDRSGRNVFEGGFLGLDNIGVFDRSAPLPTGGYLEQADGTAWMALYCQNMLEIAAELALTDPDHEDMALKFSQHFLWIASAMGHVGGETGMWDDEDGFFYDVLRLPDGQAQRLKVRSMVGLLPLCAATVFEGELLTKSPELVDRLYWFLAGRPELYATIHDPMKPGVGGRRLAAILDENGLRRVLAKMLDENEFLSPFGIRSLSRYHADHPYVIQAGGQEYRVGIVRCMEAPVSSRRTGTGAIASCSTSTSTVTTEPAWALDTRPAGPESSPGACTSLQP